MIYITCANCGEQHSEFATQVLIHATSRSIVHQDITGIAVGATQPVNIIEVTPNSNEVSIQCPNCGVVLDVDTAKITLMCRSCGSLVAEGTWDEVNKYVMEHFCKDRKLVPCPTCMGRLYRRSCVDCPIYVKCAAYKAMKKAGGA